MPEINYFHWVRSSGHGSGLLWVLSLPFQVLSNIVNMSTHWTGHSPSDGTTYSTCYCRQWDLITFFASLISSAFCCAIRTSAVNYTSLEWRVYHMFFIVEAGGCWIYRSTRRCILYSGLALSSPILWNTNKILLWASMAALWTD